MTEPTHWDGPGLDAWDPWTPEEVSAHLADVTAPWQVVGGWAVDLFLGRITRPHEDLEIAVIRSDFDEVRAALAEFVLHSVGDGEVRLLVDGASHEPDSHQTWVLEPGTQKWRVDVMLEPGDRETWECRRDSSIRAPRAQMSRRSSDGIPYLAPAGVLLYKAKGLRPKDQTDFDLVAPLLGDHERVWLCDALEVAHPGHPWVELLGGAGAGTQQDG